MHSQWDLNQDLKTFGNLILSARIPFKRFNLTETFAIQLEKEFKLWQMRYLVVNAKQSACHH